MNNITDKYFTSLIRFFIFCSPNYFLISLFYYINSGRQSDVLP